jgi:prevent-host-death family protein
VSYREGQAAVNHAAPFTEVRDKLRDILDDVVATGNQYTITRHGKPVAVIVSNDEYESLIETLNILSDSDAMDAIAEGESEQPGSME